MKKLITLPLVALLCGCASVNWQNVQQTLGTPADVQTYVTVIGALAKPKIPSNAQTSIHTYATALSGLASLNSAQLIALIPKTGSPTADALIASSTVFINIALTHWGENNSNALAYAKAVANGLLANF